jgi:chromosome segregation ATPase
MNARYDIAVKVALTKCLRYLVVDTVHSSRYVTEYLKDKGIQKDVLVLENMPSQRDKKNKISAQALQKYNAQFLCDVIDVARKANIQKAVDYFVRDKIVCASFENAVSLQRETKCTNIVTLDGTEFKQGMVSGGQHTSNIFNLSLG